MLNLIIFKNILQKHKFGLVFKYVLLKTGDVVLVEKSINVTNVNINLTLNKTSYIMCRLLSPRNAVVGTLDSWLSYKILKHKCLLGNKNNQNIKKIRH